MDRKQVTSFVATALLVLATFNISPTDGDVICPWCNKPMENQLLNCVYAELIARFFLPVSYCDSIKWSLAQESDSRSNMPYVAKKIAMDEIFVNKMADVIKENNLQNDPATISTVSESAGNCYSSVTGYSTDVVTEEIKNMVHDNIKKSTAQQGGDPNPVPNSGMPYPTNQNQPTNFQPYQPPPPNPPSSFPDKTSYMPNSGNNVPSQEQPPVNDYGSENNPGLQTNQPQRNGRPFNPPGSSPANSFDNTAPSNPPRSPPLNPSNNPYFGNNAPRPSEKWPSDDNYRRGQTGSDFNRNQAQSGGSPGTSYQNDNDSPSNKKSTDNPVIASTASPKITSPAQNSKSPNTGSSNDSNKTTPSPSVDASKKKTTGEKKPDEEPCDEKFKTALYDTLINDPKFLSMCGKKPLSKTESAVLKGMESAFEKYGISKRYPDFHTYWKFESKKLSKESTPEDWDELISKSCKVVFSRSNLLKGDCAEIGRTIAYHFLGTVPGDPSTSSTDNSNRNDGNGKTSTESNANSSDQKTNPVSNSTANASAENSSNSKNSTNARNLSFPEVHSKLTNMLKKDGSGKQDNGNVPFSEMLSVFEAKENMETLHRALESCKTPSGFNYDRFFEAMSNVTKSIQKNHPDWSHDKCEKEMHTETVAVLTKELSNTVASSNNNAQSKSSSNQPDSAVDSSDSQNSNPGAQSAGSNDFNLPSEDSPYSGPRNNFDSNGAPLPQQDFKDYGNYPDGSSYGNQPGPSDRNDGYKQPSNFAPGPVYPNYGNQPNEPNYSYDYPDYDSQPSGQSFPSQNYPAFPPDNMNTQPNSGTQSFPVSQNARYQQSPNFPPDSRLMNSPSGNFGNNQYQGGNLDNGSGFNAGPPAAGPVFPNGNSQNFQQQPYQNYNSGDPALQNGNSQNFQQQNYQNSNSGDPAVGPAIPNGNNQQFNSNYDSRFY